MTGRVQTRAVILAAIVVLSIVATGVAFTGTTIAQSASPDNTEDNSSDDEDICDLIGPPPRSCSDSDTGGGDNGGKDDVETGGVDITEVVERVSWEEPDAAAEVEIEDTQPDTPGVTVVPGAETNTVTEVTLADENHRGHVDIKEYNDSPTEVAESITEQLLQTTNADPTVDVAVTADISVFNERGEKASDAAATINMKFNRDSINSPENIVVFHETDDGWEELDTTVTEVTDETVTLTTETDGFSLFAVAEVEGDGEESPNAISDATGDSTPGFGVWVALVAMAGISLLCWRPSRSD